MQFRKYLLSREKCPRVEGCSWLKDCSGKWKHFKIVILIWSLQIVVMAIRTKLDGDDNADFEEGGWLYLEKRSRERGDRRWKATLTEPADSELKHAIIFSTVISDHWKSIYSSTSWPLANIKLWWYYTWEKCDWVWISPKMLNVLLHPSKSHHLFSGPCQSVDHKPQDFWNQVSILSDIKRPGFL